MGLHQRYSYRRKKMGVGIVDKQDKKTKWKTEK